MNNTLLKKYFFILSFFVLFLAPASAQNLNEEIQKKDSVQKSKKEQAVAVAESKESGSLNERDGISYADILKDPDNIELNYRYANSLILKGDLKGSAAVLERILMVDPALPKIRLHYAIVLYRLDNLHEAKRELDALKSLPMTDSLRGEIDAYLDRIKKKLQHTNWNAVAGIGQQFDTNRNATPATGRRFFGGRAIDVTPGRRSDFSTLFLLGLGVEHDIGSQQGHKLFADLTHYRAEQVLVDALDLQVYAWNLGARLNGGRWGEWSVSMPFDHLRLSEETYLRTYGARIDWEKRLNNRWGLWSEFQASRHDYVKTTDIPTATDRTGEHVHFDYGIHHSLNAAHRLTAGLGHAKQGARKNYNAYNRHKLQAKHSWFLGGGAFLLSGLTIQLDRYDEADTAIASGLREDDAFRAGSTFGYPLGKIWSPLDNLLWTFTYEYFHSFSNLINYAYTNNKISTMFTYRWDR